MILILGCPEDENFIQNLKRSVREAALMTETCSSDVSLDNHSDDGSGHFFLPLSSKGFSPMGTESQSVSRSKKLFASPNNASSFEDHAHDSPVGSKYDEVQLPNVIDDLESLNDFDQVNGFLLGSGMNRATTAAQRLFYDIEESQGQVFSPPLLMESSLLADSYEDLLGMLLYLQILSLFAHLKALTCMNCSRN